MTLRLHTNADLGEAELRVVEAHGWERVSELYEYTVQVEVSQAGGLDDDALDELINSPVKLDVAGGVMTVHGVVKRVIAHSTSAEVSPLCELVIGPRCSTRRSAASILARMILDDSVDPPRTPHPGDHLGDGRFALEAQIADTGVSTLCVALDASSVLQ